jgi:hypothetical protein
MLQGDRLGPGGPKAGSVPPGCGEEAVTAEMATYEYGRNAVSI